MKSIFMLLLSFLMCSGTGVLAQDNNFHLFPQSGKKYIYRFTESNYQQTKEGEKRNEYLRTKILELEYLTSQADNRKLLYVTVTKNTAEYPGSQPYAILDYEYPYFKDGFYTESISDFWESLLCGVVFKYEFDEDNSEVKLFNRDELLLTIRKILDKKGFENTLKNRRTEDFNTIAIPAINKYVQALYKLNSEILDPQDYDTSIEGKESVIKIPAKQWDKKPGLYERNITINKAENYLMEYQTIDLDSAQLRMDLSREFDGFIYREQKIELINIDEKEGALVTISGTLENPGNKKVTLAYLDKPFGNELHQESVFLDENNSFQISTELPNPELVVLIFGQTEARFDVPTFMFYVEPGSQIQFKASSEFPWEMDFSGDFADAQKLLYSFNKEHNWIKQRINFKELSWWRFSQMQYSNLKNAIDNFDSFTAEYREGIPDYVFRFVTDELKANLMCGVLSYASMIESSRRRGVGRIYFAEQDIVDEKYLEKVLEATEIHQIYNPYGLYSRQFAGAYLNYYFSKVNLVSRINTLGYNIVSDPLTSIVFTNDLPQKIEVAKLLLAGPALYGQIADILVREKSTVYNQITKDIAYYQQEVDKYFDLILRVCNDREFTESLNDLLDEQSKWDKKDYVPDIEFFNEKAEPKYLNDYFGEKPTLFYITGEWSRERYFFDDLAKENPEINFVLIAEGSNIQEWMDYTKRAEPIAYQLFLINIEEQFSSIFKSNTGHFIAYDKDGVRIGFARNMVTGMNLCEQSLQPKKKELNKSQLQIIILVLLIILTILVIGFLLWKWRVRQRFRKEEQKRKLRELELTAIRSQMNPHFLFNALNSVQNLVQQNKGREAHLYLSDFAGLIRKVLNNSEKEEVSLAEEMEMVRQYLSLEKLRFDFDFTIEVDTQIDIHNTLVPSMLMQPFVENAVIHGLQSKTGNRQLKVEVSKEAGKKTGSHIKITIEDNGIGRNAAKEIAKHKNGKGTKLMKERLNALQKKQNEKYELKTIDFAEGTRVEIIIPEES
ncbi:MAG TPA: histidine kinase [Draconibacterium sp.]|nr:histidine kinase [Draconibacterium sp.]